jgi:hypothetical protein
LNELGRIVTSRGIDGRAVDIHGLFGNETCTAVDGFAHTVEDATEHILGYGKLYTVAGEANFTICQVDACGRLEELNEYVSAVDFQNTATANFTVGQFNFTEFVILNAFDLLDKH